MKMTEIVPRRVRPTACAERLVEELAGVGWALGEDALLVLDAAGAPEADVVLAETAAQALEAVRGGALEALAWPAERSRLGEALERARGTVAERLRGAAIEAAWRVSGDWVEITDPSARLVDVNEGFERISGYPASEAIGRTPGELFRAGTHGPAFYATVHELASTVGWQGGFVGRRRDGSWCVQDVRIGAVRRRGRVATMYAVKRSAGDPGASTLSALLGEDASLPWMLVRTVDGMVMEASASARRHLGLPAGSGATVGAIGLGHALPAVGEEVRFDVAQGEVVWELHARGVLVGDAPIAIVVLRDVTVRRRREEELDRLAGQLRAARDQAEAADHAKSVFLAGMSHELRTPLNAILGYTELLLEGLHEPDQRADAERVIHAGRHLLALVDDLLDLARIEAGRMDLEMRPVAARGLLEEVADALRLRAAARGQHLEVVGPPVTVTADPRRLRQILLNLVTNATKYAVPGRVELGVELDPTPVVWVSDDGPGLDEAAQRRIFQPYVQVGRGAGGVGLGLAISRRLATAMGLELGVRSAAGEGTRFSLRFPSPAPASS